MKNSTQKHQLKTYSQLTVEEQQKIFGGRSGAPVTSNDLSISGIINSLKDIFGIGK